MNPIDIIHAIYWTHTVSLESPQRSELARVILWNAMYHLDYEYSSSYRVPTFHKDWAINKSNINLENYPEESE